MEPGRITLAIFYFLFVSLGMIAGYSIIDTLLEVLSTMGFPSAMVGIFYAGIIIIMGFALIGVPILILTQGTE